MKQSSTRRKAKAGNGHYSGCRSAITPERTELSVSDHIRHYSLWRIGHAELFSPTSSVETGNEADYMPGAALITGESSDFNLPRL